MRGEEATAFSAFSAFSGPNVYARDDLRVLVESAERVCQRGWGETLRYALLLLAGSVRGTAVVSAAACVIAIARR
jgi:hypothetical protein